MADNAILEGLMKQIADLKKLVDEAKAGNATKTEEIKKQAEDLASKLFESRRGEMLKELRKGVYAAGVETEKPSHEVIVAKSADPRIQAFQKFNDDVYLLSKIMRTHPQNLKMWQKYAPAHSELRKAMDSITAAEGLEWLPSDFSADLIDRVRLATKVAGLFSRIAMPTDPYKLPVVSSDATGYLVTETSADDPSAKAFTASTPGSTNVSLDAKKLGARVQFSAELVEDSIVPVLEFIKNNISIALAFALEDAIINGDLAGTHMDSDVTASTDARKAWDGLRKMAQDSNQVSLATLSTANLRSMRGTMGKYGVDPSKLVWLCSAKGYVKLLGLAEVITVDKYGQFATVLSGELGKFDGIPIVVSEKVRDSLNASGVNDATSNAKGEILLVYVPGMVLGEKRKVTIKSFEDVERDQSVLVASWRGAFAALHAVASNALVIEGINLTV